MFARILIAAGALALFTGAAHAAQPETCPAGGVTIEKLAAGLCLERIPLPQDRPTDMDAVVEAPQRTPVEVVYVETNDTMGNVRKVRLIGPRFLPDTDRDRAFAAIMHERESGAVAGFVSAAWSNIASAFGDRQDEGGTETAAMSSDAQIVRR